MKILIADDSATNRAILSVLITQLGHQPIQAEDGYQAVELFERELPDMVIMDVMMPVEDGLSATMRIKSLPSGKLTPIIIITSLDSDEDVIKGLEAGADDYFTKPIKVQVVKAKIHAIDQMVDIRQQILVKKQELEQYYFAAEDEKRLTSHIMQRLTEPAKLNDPALQYWIKPADYCSGDLLAATRTPGGSLYLLLADGTGHGLSAALDVVSLPQIFYAMASIAHPIGSIASEMNTKIKSLLPTGHFVAATLVSINPNDQTLEFWNGGNPPACIINAERQVIHRAVSRHLPIGVVDANKFDSSTEIIRLTPGAQLMLFSDGLPDASNAQLKELGLEHIFEVILAAKASDRMEQLKSLVEAHIGDSHRHDDISVILVETDHLLNHDEVLSMMHHPILNAGSGWHMSLRLGHDELRNLDPIPFTIDLLKKLRVSDSHLSSLFLIISELINNAIDHGLLKLESKLKDGLDGFDVYLEQRSERLERLAKSAKLEIEFDHHSFGEEQRQKLTIRVKDSGKGFEYKKICEKLDEGQLTHGRGIGLVKKIAEEVVYKGSGNEVVVTYAF